MDNTTPKKLPHFILNINIVFSFIVIAAELIFLFLYKSTINMFLSGLILASQIVQLIVILYYRIQVKRSTK
jgi:hypothetical protein